MQVQGNTVFDEPRAFLVGGLHRDSCDARKEGRAMVVDVRNPTMIRAWRSFVGWLLAFAVGCGNGGTGSTPQPGIMTPGETALGALDHHGSQWYPYLEWNLENPSWSGNPFDVAATANQPDQE